LYLSAFLSDEAAGTSEDEFSWEKMEAVEVQESSGNRPGDQELKEMLLHKYGGYLSSLRKEFLKKRKKGKLPKEARRILLDWWSTHYRWPYPTVIQIHIIKCVFVYVMCISFTQFDLIIYISEVCPLSNQQ